MLEWNAFIKPIVYVVELIFAAVVTIGTADRLLFYDESQGRLRCVFNDNIGACSSIISLGALCMVGGIYVLWKRLSSAFLCDMKYRNDTECAMCFLLSIGWLCVASVVTAFRAVPNGISETFLRAERRITISFAWLLWVFHIGSMAIAWFVPDEDDAEESHYEALGAEPFPVDEYDLSLEGVPPGVAAWPPLRTQEPLPDRVETTPLTPQFTDLTKFLEQHDSIDLDEARLGTPQFEISEGSGLDSGSPVGGMGYSELQPKESIQDVASLWKEMISADRETATPELEIVPPPQQSPDPLSLGGSSAAGASSSSQPRPTPTLRRRTVRFTPEVDVEHDST